MAGPRAGGVRSMGVFFSRRKKQKAERNGGRLGLLALIAVALFAASASTFWLLDKEWRQVIEAADRLVDAFLEHEIFAVREIKVKGGEKLGGAEIVALAALKHGASVWKVDPVAAEKRVAAHPWVRRVLVRREFPRRVVIEVEEREAKAIAVLGALYYVDREGFVFKQVEPGDNMDFPLLTGLEPEDLAYPTSFATRQRIQEALRLNDLMGQDPLAVSEIHFLKQGGVTLYPMTYRLALQMGWGEWEEKLSRLERVLALWKGQEERLGVLDFRFRDQVVARAR